MNSNDYEKLISIAKKEQLDISNLVKTQQNCSN